MDIYPTQIYSREYDNSIKICIDCIDKCNYTCYYCYNTFFNYKRTNIEIDFDKVLLLIQKIRNDNLNKHIIVELIGGEPTLHSNFIKFVHALNLIQNIEILVFTNFSKDIDFYQETISKYHIKYKLSFHYIDDNHTLLYIKKIKQIANNNFKYGLRSLNIMLQPLIFTKLILVFNELYNYFLYGANCSLITWYDRNKKLLSYSNYSSEQFLMYFDICKKNNFLKNNIVTFNNGSTELYSNNDIKNNSKKFNFKLWQCDAGLNYIYIRFDGNIYPCGNIMDKCIGSIHNIPLIKFHKTICTSNVCSCEYGLKKYRIFNK